MVSLLTLTKIFVIYISYILTLYDYNSYGFWQINNTIQKKTTPKPPTKCPLIKRCVNDIPVLVHITGTSFSGHS